MRGRTRERAAYFFRTSFSSPHIFLAKAPFSQAGAVDLDVIVVDDDSVAPCMCLSFFGSRLPPPSNSKTIGSPEHCGGLHPRLVTQHAVMRHHQVRPVGRVDRDHFMGLAGEERLVNHAAASGHLDNRHDLVGRLAVFVGDQPCSHQLFHLLQARVGGWWRQFGPGLVAAIACQQK